MADEITPLMTLAQAKELVAHLEADEISEANIIIKSVQSDADTVFVKVGELTRELHDSLMSFQRDNRLLDLADQELPEAKDRLNYVIEMTDKAANKTMDSLDICIPIADNLFTDFELISPVWNSLMDRSIKLNDFKALCHQVDDLIKASTVSTAQLKNELTDILMAQDFQDLTGQIIKRVIVLVHEIEAKLVAILSVCRADYPNEASFHQQEEILANANEKDIKAEGPILNAEEREDAVNGQDDVDDLLSSLGF